MYNKYKQKISSKDKSIMLKMRNSGIPVSEICQKFSCSHNTVYRSTKNYNGKINHPRYKTSNIKHDYFSQENLQKFPERFVIIGFIAADGCISKRNNDLNLIFNLAIKDKIALDIINKEICNNDRTISNIKCTNSCMLSIPSKQICKDLFKYNIVPRKTKIMKLPKLNKLEMKYYLRGFTYGDGCIYQYSNRLTISYVGNKLIMEEINNYLLNNNIVNKTIFYPRKNTDNYYLVTQGKHAEKYYRYLMNDDKMMLLSRKHVL